MALCLGTCPTPTLCVTLGRFVIRIKTGNGIKNISIFNTYAPHMQYNQDALAKYRNGVDNTHSNIYLTMLLNSGAPITTGIYQKPNIVIIIFVTG